MKYCPRCGSEYVEGIERCSDCDVALVDEPTDPTAKPPRPEVIERAVVYTSGRRIDAEMVRGRVGDGQSSPVENPDDPTLPNEQIACGKIAVNP